MNSIEENANSLHQIGWIKTFSGKLVQPLDLKPDDICIEDIANALSRICRFAGHCHGDMNVAAHSVRVLARFITDNPNATNRERLTALLHDASEAYLGDLPRPLKRHPSFAFYREIEGKAEEVIAERFGLLYPMPINVRDADNAELRLEMETTRYDPFIEDPIVSMAEYLFWFKKLGGL